MKKGTGTALKHFRLGSRGSDLALWQSRQIMSLLGEIWTDCSFELEIIKTQGDQVIDKALSDIGDKGLFTREIEKKLLDGEIDLAVHSHKDLPTESPAGLTIAAVPVREDPADVLIVEPTLVDSLPSAEQHPSVQQILQGMPGSARVLTGSLRRAAQLLHYRSDLCIEPIRGNVPTRLEKFASSNSQALILAAAGLRRLNLMPETAWRLNPAEFLPACAQGALAVQIREDDARTAQIVAALDDASTRSSVSAERALLAELEGGCQVPIGSYAEMRKDQVHLAGMVASLDGKDYVRREISGMPSDAAQLGQNLARQLRDAGGREILEAIRLTS